MKILIILLNIGFVIKHMKKVKRKIIINYRGSAHQKCNVNLSLSKIIPFVFHNLQNHDSHLISQEIGKYNFKINLIPKTIDNYMSFTIQ